MCRAVVSTKRMMHVRRETQTNYDVSLQAPGLFYLYSSSVGRHKKTLLPS